MILMLKKCPPRLKCGGAFLLILIVVVVLPSCGVNEAGKDSPETMNFLSLLDDLYGSDAIAYLPEAGQYFRLVPEYLPYAAPTIKAVQLNITEEEEFYSGTLYSCVPDKAVFSPGDKVRITVTSHNPNDTTGGPTFRLDMLVDGAWYAINRMVSWPETEYSWMEGKEISYVISKDTLCRMKSLSVDPDTGRLMIPAEQDESPLQLPEGTYRFSTWVFDEVQGESCHLMCQFQVAGE